MNKARIQDPTRGFLRVLVALELLVEDDAFVLWVNLEHHYTAIMETRVYCANWEGA